MADVIDDAPAVALVDPVPALLALLGAVDRSDRAALAMAPDSLAVGVALPELSPAFASLRAGIKLAGVPLAPWLKAVRIARSGRDPQAGPWLRLVGADGSSPPAPPDARAVVKLGPELQQNVDDAIEALGTDPDVYAHGTSLVHVVEVDGAPIIHTIAAPTLRERLGASARFMRFDVVRNDWEHVVAPDQVVQAAFARKTWPSVRCLAGVIEAPTLRPDGSILSAPGYDPPTRLEYRPTIVFPGVPDEPTQAQAMVALGEIAEVFCDFPYRAEADRYGTISALLSVFARGFVVGNVPGFLFDASTPSSGKSLQALVIHLVATGRDAEALGLAEEEDEREKFFSAIATSGQPIVLLDDLDEDGPGFGGPCINRLLTCGGVTGFRILGKNEKASLPWRCVVLASGNNVPLRGAIERRILMPRLEPDVERPEDRTGFRHPDLLAWVRENRGRLVAAALTVLRAYIFAGMPDMGCASLGSFEHWSKVIPGAIVYAGGVDPMGCRPAAGPSTGSEERATVRVLLEGLARLDTQSGGSGLTVRAVLDALYPTSRDHGPPDGFGDLREAIEALTNTPPGKRPSGQRLARGVLAKWKRRIVNGTRLDIIGETRTGVVLWKVMPA